MVVTSGTWNLILSCKEATNDASADRNGVARAPIGRSVALNACSKEGVAAVEACFGRISKENSIAGLQSVHCAVIVWVGGRGRQDM